jgi:hypothetical protein
MYFMVGQKGLGRNQYKSEISVFGTEHVYFVVELKGLGVDEYESKDTYCADAYGTTRRSSQDRENVRETQREPEFLNLILVLRWY